MLLGQATAPWLMVVATARSGVSVAAGTSQGGIVVSKALRAFTQDKPAFVVDWGLSRTTLEDVFLRMVRTDDGTVAAALPTSAA